MDFIVNSATCLKWLSFENWIFSLETRFTVCLALISQEKFLYPGMSGCAKMTTTNFNPLKNINVYILFRGPQIHFFVSKWNLQGQGQIHKMVENQCQQQIPCSKVNKFLGLNHVQILRYNYFFFLVLGPKWHHQGWDLSKIIEKVENK